MKPLQFRFVLCILLSVTPAWAMPRTYELSAPAGFDSSPYGFAGTITTDGLITATPDSLSGRCGDGSCITSWSIVLSTPSAIDGVASQVLTESNSTLEIVRASSSPVINTSVEAIFLGTGAGLFNGEPDPSIFSIVAAGGGERLSFLSSLRNSSAADPDGVFPRIEVRDLSENAPVFSTNTGVSATSNRGLIVAEASGGTEPLCDPNSQGDADGNGKVEFADFLILSANFGKGVSSHTLGDFDCNGTVQFSDFLTLSGKFGTEVGAASVPEPSSSPMIILGCLGLLGARRRR